MDDATWVINCPNAKISINLKQSQKSGNDRRDGSDLIDWWFYRRKRGDNEVITNIPSTEFGGSSI